MIRLMAFCPNDGTAIVYPYGIVAGLFSLWRTPYDDENRSEIYEFELPRLIAEQSFEGGEKNFSTWPELKDHLVAMASLPEDTP
jgi:hypothetical protein